MARKVNDAKESKEEARLCVYSQEFKLWNYSDGESAHYVKRRLGVRAARKASLPCAIAGKAHKSIEVRAFLEMKTRTNEI